MFGISLGCIEAPLAHGRGVGGEASHHGDGCRIDGGVGVDEGGVVGIEAGAVVGGLGSEVHEVLAIEADAVVVDVVGVLVLVAAVGGEEDDALLLVNVEDFADTPGARGEDSPPALPMREGVVTFASRG